MFNALVKKEVDRAKQVAATAEAELTATRQRLEAAEAAPRSRVGAYAERLIGVIVRDATPAAAPIDFDPSSPAALHGFSLPEPAGDADEDKTYSFCGAFGDQPGGGGGGGGTA